MCIEKLNVIGVCYSIYISISKGGIIELLDPVLAKSEYLKL